jgi:CRISPR-associated protein Cas1
MWLILDRPGLTLDYERAALLVREPDRPPRPVPVRQVERVVAGPRLEISAGVLGLLAEHGVSLLVLNHRHPDRTAELVAREAANARRRLAQYAFLGADGPRRAWARAVVGLKVRRQHALLARAQRERPDLPLGGVLRRLDALAGRLADPAGEFGLDTLRGLEGAAAAAYFEGYPRLFAPALGFTQRRRRPPPDPVNACLSLGYTLLHAEASGAARAAGLDPLLGGFHEPVYGQNALASDLIEPLRPALDAWVWGLFRGAALRREHFRLEDGACFLQRHAQGVFYEAIHDRMRVWRRLLRRYARRFAAGLPEAA